MTRERLIEIISLSIKEHGSVYCHRLVNRDVFVFEGEIDVGGIADAIIEAERERLKNDP